MWENELSIYSLASVMPGAPTEEKFLDWYLQILKETRNSYFCVTPKNHQKSLKRLKSAVIKKSNFMF